MIRQRGTGSVPAVQAVGPGARPEHPHSSQSSSDHVRAQDASLHAVGALALPGQDRAAAGASAEKPGIVSDVVRWTALMREREIRNPEAEIRRPNVKSGFGI